MPRDSAAETETVLVLEDVHTYYGTSHILQGVSLEVRDGETVSLLGRNGAGKTTTMRSIMGLTRPRRGRVSYNGRTISGLPPYKVAGSGIALVPQGRRIFPALSVEENLLIVRNNGGRWNLERVYTTFPRLKERRTNGGGQLSGGEQQMLALARALMLNPTLVLMDEPSEGLAPLIVREIGAIIADLKKDGMSVLLVEQNLGLGLSVADRCYVLTKGQVVHESSAEELRANDEVKHRYLGV